MNKKVIVSALAFLLSTITGAAIACEYKKGETKFLDYAHCRYGEDSILVIDLPESANWEKCIYYVQPWTPEKLLAVTKESEGVEKLSISNRSQIGNPCYMTKKYCDAALRAFNQ